MTTAAPSAAPQMSRVRYLSLAVGASLVQMTMMIPGYSDNGSFQAMAWFTVLAISLVVGLLVFSFAVPHGGAMTGIVLGAVAVLSILVFWAGVTCRSPQPRSWSAGDCVSRASSGRRPPSSWRSAD